MSKSNGLGLAIITLLLAGCATMPASPNVQPKLI